MNQKLIAKNNNFRDEVIPNIISGYPSLIKKYYDKSQTQKSISQELGGSYKPKEKQYVEIDYTSIQLQKVYLMRYYIPHAVLIPFVLDSLSRRNSGDLLHTAYLELLKSNALKVSFFGGGPSPELYGLRHYLNEISPNTTDISSAVLDKTKWQIAMKPEDLFETNLIAPSGSFVHPLTFVHPLAADWVRSSEVFFETNLIAPSGSFLHPEAADWVRSSDLVVMQICLNEIPCSDCNYNPQLLINMKQIVSLLKHGSLMLVIERCGYELVDNLLCDFREHLTASNNLELKIVCEAREKEKLVLDYSYSNMDISTNMISDLHSDWLSMNRLIKFQWLAVSKSSYYN